MKTSWTSEEIQQRWSLMSHQEVRSLGFNVTGDQLAWLALHRDKRVESAMEPEDPMDLWPLEQIALKMAHARLIRRGILQNCRRPNLGRDGSPSRPVGAVPDAHGLITPRATGRHQPDRWVSGPCQRKSALSQNALDKENFEHTSHIAGFPAGTVGVFVSGAHAVMTPESSPQALLLIDDSGDGKSNAIYKETTADEFFSSFGELNE